MYKNRKLTMIFNPHYLSIWEIWMEGGEKTWSAFYYTKIDRNEILERYIQQSKLDAIHRGDYIIARYKNR